jgi:predicted Zn-dependent protease
MKLTMLLLVACSAYGVDLRYWIEPCTRPETGCQKTDTQLADWALQAWQAVSNGKLHLARTDRMTDANIRIHWADSGEGKYGETRAFESGGKRGAEVYVMPDLRGMGLDIFAAATQDGLLRETIVYLTCLHETGHALGLSHTDDFADIMYFFGYDKGDVREYFGRYRRTLHDRADIAKNSGISPQDRARFIQTLK